MKNGALFLTFVWLRDNALRSGGIIFFAIFFIVFAYLAWKIATKLSPNLFTQCLYLAERTQLSIYIDFFLSNHCDQLVDHTIVTTWVKTKKYSNNMKISKLNLWTFWKLWSLIIVDVCFVPLLVLMTKTH